MLNLGSDSQGGHHFMCLLAFCTIKYQLVFNALMFCLSGLPAIECRPARHYVVRAAVHTFCLEYFAKMHA